MGKLYFRVASDWEEVVKLRNEIEKLKQTLLSMDKNRTPAAVEALEVQLGSARQKMDGLVASAAKAGAVMENDFKKRIFDASQSVNGFTEKIINQKAVVKDIEADVRRLGDAYRIALKRNPLSSGAKLDEWNSAKRALNEEKSALFELTQQQATSRLSVTKLRQEYSLYKDDSAKVISANSDITGSMKEFILTIAGADAIKSFISNVIDVTGNFQKMESVLSNTLGSTSKAKETMDMLADFGAKTPFQVDELTAAYVKLANQGFTPTMAQMRKLGDLASSTGKSFDQLAEAIIDAQVGENERLKEFGIRASKNGDLIKFTFKEQETTVKNTASAIREYILSLGDLEGVTGANEKISATFVGRLSNIQDELTNQFKNFGEQFSSELSGGINSAAVLVENLNKIIPVIGGLVAAYGAYKAAVLAVSAAHKAGALYENIRLIGMMRKELGLATAAQQAFNTASKANIYAALISVLFGLGTAVYMFTKRTNEATEANNSLNKVSKNTSEEYAKQAADIDKLTGFLKSETASLTLKRDKLKELKDIIPGYNAELNEEGKLINNNTEAIKAYLTQLEKQIKLKAAQEELGELYRKKRLQEKEIKVKEKNAEREKKNVPDVVYGGDLGIEAQRNALSRAADAENALKQANAELKITEKNIGEIQNEIEKTSISTSDDKKSEIQNKSYWETKKKDAQSQLDSLSDIEAVGKKGIELKNKIAEYDKKISTFSVNTSKQESAAEKLRKQNDKVKEVREKNIRDQIRYEEDLGMEVWQSYIDTLDEGGEKTIEQMDLNHEKELQSIDRQKADLLQKKKEEARVLFDADPANKGKSFNESVVSLSPSENQQFDDKYKLALNKQSKERQAYYDREKQAMNEYLSYYGTYQQKRQAIIDNGEVKKKGKNDWEKKSIDQETKKLLAGIDDEAQRKTSIITKLFSDMSMRTVADIRLIANEAKNMLAYINGGEFKADSNGVGLFGITKEQFDILSKSPEKLESIKNEIANVNREADAAEAALGKMATGLKKVFSSNPVKFKEGLSNLSDGMNQLTQSGKFLSESLSSLGDSLGSGALNEIASGVDVAMDAMSSTMDGAKAGAAFGPWGAAAGAAIGMVTSLASSFAKIHDAKNEKRIQVLQGQIEVLEKTYDTLGESIEKAYSKDASRLIAQQNTLLEQQKVLIRNQIAEEEQKKKSDSGRIEDWKKQIEDINKLIGENKVKLVDAIFGEDIKSAIDNFAQSYGDAWSSNENKVKSSKNAVKDMMRQMVTESIKAAIQSSKSIEQIRSKLQEFYADNILSGWEQNYIYNMAEELQKELDKQFGWADSLMKDDKSSQDSTKGSFQAMSQDTGDELNGRFTALQISNEEIKNQGVLQAQSLEILSVKTDAILFVSTETRDIADETRTILANSYIELVQISENTGTIIKPIKDIARDIAEVKKNTAGLGT